MLPAPPNSRLELRPMLSLAVPVVVGELGWMAMGVVDTMMVGRLGTEALGALSIGRVLFMGLAVFGIGLLLGLDTVASQAFGSRNPLDGMVSLIQCVYLCFVIGPVATGLFRLGLIPLRSFGIDAEVLAVAVPYMQALGWSALPLFLYTTFRRYLQAINHVRPVMLALVSANLVNVFANWILIFGRLGAPALGAEGAGWATTIAMTYMALFLLVAVLVHDRGQGSRLLRVPFRIDPARLRRLLALGLPAALQIGLEVGVFALATAMAGLLEPAALAAHHVALTIASVTFMVPLGISSAAAVRVGQAVGRGDAAGVGRAGWTAQLLGAAFMSGAAITFLLFPAALMRVFTADPRVVSVGAGLLAVAAFFQLFDGAQVIATGSLRGVGDTRNPMVWSLIGHWCLGLPVAYYLCFPVGWGVTGLWIGLAAGLTLIGTVLLVVWSRRT